MGDAPHTSHADGPGSFIPWKTSSRWPFGHLYS